MTPQVSYMKAIDWWVFVCLAFVFSSLAEYGLILHLTCRSSWQRRIDQLHKMLAEKNSEPRREETRIRHRLNLRYRRTLSAQADLGALPKTNEMRNLNSNNEANSTRHELTEQDTSNPLMVDVEVGTSNVQKLRWNENLAYNIEFYIKILYPSLFLMFNIVYWIMYL